MMTSSIVSRVLKLRFFFHETEFTDLFLCTVNINNNIEIRTR